jgi:hypothetical protein
MANTIFKLALSGALPDRSTAKAARVLGVNQRTVQKWIADEATPPPGVIAELNRIGEIMRDMEVMPILRQIIEEWRDADGPPDALASALAAAYKELTGVEIE